MISGALGGTNWPGGSYDPDTHTVYASANQQIIGLGLLPVTDKRFSDSAYVGGDVHSRTARRLRGTRATVLVCTADNRRTSPLAPGNPSPPPGMGGGFLGAPTIEGLPINKPPYGVISAINLDRGEVVWQVAHGDTPDAVRNHPKLKGLNIPRTGQTDQRRHTRHEDPRDCRRAERDHDCRPSARRAASRVRQGDRQGRGRGVHGGAADRVADDLHVERQAVHRRGHRRRRDGGGVRRVSACPRRAAAAVEEVAERRSSRGLGGEPAEPE